MSAKDILCTYFYTNNFNRFKVITLTISNYGETWGGYFKTNYMKLYTEEQVRNRLNVFLLEPTTNKILESLTPIELPSDDEIARVGLDFSVGYNVEYWNGFKHCGEWMKQQILNQNK